MDEDKKVLKRKYKLLVFSNYDDMIKYQMQK